MTATNEMLAREARGITFSRKKNAREFVDKAFAASEKMAWNTLKERQEGDYRWPRIPYTSAVDEEENLEIAGARWKEYRENMKLEKDLKKDNKAIAPTKPNRPIGHMDKENIVPSNRAQENKSQRQIVNEWIEKVMMEEEMKKRNRSEEKMGDVEAGGKRQRSHLSELKGGFRSKK